ncbi:hypothetical protein E2986_10927 [Frieseomelitta varia]|uniref:Uncharacterized protein n=1 Tax=Frieseomelitta varia TaxID=561572 RepID=A0A833VZU0_9HYME|nr:hypothetical protein E2986_10927 [Frieseomelitta varia]
MLIKKFWNRRGRPISGRQQACNVIIRLLKQNAAWVVSLFTTFIYAESTAPNYSYFVVLLLLSYVNVL